MQKKIILAILSVIISASLIFAPSLSVFAFGSLSFDDEEMQNFYYNNQVVKSTSGYPGYHIRWADGTEIICKMNLCSPSNYVSSSIISLPVAISNMKYFFVVKCYSGPSVNITASPSTYSSYGCSEDCYCFRTLGYKDSSGTVTYNISGRTYVGSWDSNHDFKNNLIWLGSHSIIPPILLYFNSYLYIVIPVYGNIGSYANSHLSFVQYESVRYSELKSDELNAIGAFDSNFANAENVPGLSATSDVLSEPAVDASSESESYSEQFSQIESLISNIDDFSSLASSNLAEVSGDLQNTRDAIDTITGWLPRSILIFCVFGLVVLIIVKVMGR